MATFTTFAHRLLLAGGFAVAVSAAPLVAALAAPAGPAAPVLAECPPGQVLDAVTGACSPIVPQAPQTLNPISPGVTDLAPGALTETNPGNVGQLPEINGIPCTGANTGKCIGLEQNNPAGAPGAPTLAPVVPGVPG
ncbi:intersectin-EH binding protein Ibp1 [Mycolicibacterium sp.]|uniref:intersectin-EH binding protein Ibp1 n=1 Tax=Mycolicibacterium sp. TaxID=2320850 RepID=UPI0028AFD2F7|nr:intersectin-EH binding protein Ibp1 [Mycolicibacterium sp.]